MRIERYGKTRYWAVIDTDGSLVCLCVYKRGALEVQRRLQVQQKYEGYPVIRPGATPLLAIHQRRKIP
jgi:hypothetical protein